MYCTPKRTNINQIGKSFVLSVDHEMAGRSPKLGERVYARSPNFGYPLNFRELLTIGDMLESKYDQ